MLNYPFIFPKVWGHFKKRINRFVVEVAVNGRTEQAHLANPGRLWELLLPETELLLSPAQPGGKLPYTVLACRKEGQNVLLHTHLTNKVVHSLIEEERLQPFAGYKVAKTEPRWERRRFDLLLEHRRTGANLYLEVKSCTLFEEKVAMFPDAITARGASHLKKLDELATKGIRTGALFVIMSPQAEYFLPAYHVDAYFTSTFLSVRSAVQLEAVALGFDREFVTVKSVTPARIPFDFLEKLPEDKGVYLLLVSLEKKTTITVGSLGKIDFEKGFYVYVGSAQNGLSRRIARHRRKKKTKRWHIDYLTALAETITPVPIVTMEDLECELSAKVENLAVFTVKGFGSSDCRCPGHLHYFAENPLSNRPFIALIQFYRLGRLEQKLKTLS